MKVNFGDTLIVFRLTSSFTDIEDDAQIVHMQPWGGTVAKVR